MGAPRVTALLAADFDGEPGLDLLAENLGDEGIDLLLNRGHGTFHAGSSFAKFHLFPSPTSLALADFNRDHRPDLAILEQGEIRFYLTACP